MNLTWGSATAKKSDVEFIARSLVSIFDFECSKKEMCVQVGFEITSDIT